MELPQVEAVPAAIGKLAAVLQEVESEVSEVGRAAGRVLAEPLVADRDSPAIDVSAMDGYAIRLCDLSGSPLPVATTTPAGAPPAQLPAGAAIRIFTGAPIPQGADCVVKREDTTEGDDVVRINTAADTLRQSSHIRHQGENTAAGDEILPAGAFLTPVAMSAVASFSPATLRVRRRARVTILNTGDELAQAGESVERWQIRDSNGPMLEAWLAGLPWIKLVARRRVGDRFEEVQRALEQALAESDAVLLTGGVSMGDADYVPEAIEKVGGQIVFHRLPIRPGKPVLGATAGGKLILGLPGNPVSVAVTSRVFGLPLLGALVGRPLGGSGKPLVPVANPDDKRLDLTWYRLIEVDSAGQVRWGLSQGSGDLVSLARSGGFAEVPPGKSGPGPWRLFRWDAC